MARHLGCFIAVWAIALSPLDAQDAGARPGDIASAFHIAKSGNRNQVHYGVHVSTSCSLTGDAPMFAYWRDLEDGANATSRLTSVEEGGYGIAYQRRATRADGTILLRVALRGLPQREIQITTGVVGGRCTAEARTRIGGTRASLEQIFVQTRGIFGVEWFELRGRHLGDGVRVRERVAM